MLHKEVFKIVFIPLLSAILNVSCAKPLPVLIELPDFSLTDQQGRGVGKKDLLGKVWVANFIYSGCGDVCPMLTQKMKGLQEATAESGGGIRLVSFTVDPENDTPERLKSYAEAFQADPERWFFLTGPMEEIEKTVVGGFKMGMEKSSAFQIMHGERFVLVDQQGRIRGFFDADKTGLEALRKALRLSTK